MSCKVLAEYGAEILWLKLCSIYTILLTFTTVFVVVLCRKRHHSKSSEEREKNRSCQVLFSENQSADERPVPARNKNDCNPDLENSKSSFHISDYLDKPLNKDENKEFNDTVATDLGYSPKETLSARESAEYDEEASEWDQFHDLKNEAEPCSVSNEKLSSDKLSLVDYGQSLSVSETFDKLAAESVVSDVYDELFNFYEQKEDYNNKREDLNDSDNLFDNSIENSKLDDKIIDEIINSCVGDSFKLATLSNNAASVTAFEVKPMVSDNVVADIAKLDNVIGLDYVEKAEFEHAEEDVSEGKQLEKRKTSVFVDDLGNVYITQSLSKNDISAEKERTVAVNETFTYESESGNVCVTRILSSSLLNDEIKPILEKHDKQENVVVVNDNVSTMKQTPSYTILSEQCEDIDFNIKKPQKVVSYELDDNILQSNDDVDDENVSTNKLILLNTILSKQCGEIDFNIKIPQKTVTSELVDDKLQANDDVNDENELANKSIPSITTLSIECEFNITESKTIVTSELNDNIFQANDGVDSENVSTNKSIPSITILSKECEFNIKESKTIFASELNDNIFQANDGVDSENVSTNKSIPSITILSKECEFNTTESKTIFASELNDNILQANDDTSKNEEYIHADSMVVNSLVTKQSVGIDNYELKSMDNKRYTACTNLNTLNKSQTVVKCENETNEQDSTETDMNKVIKNINSCEKSISVNEIASKDFNDMFVVANILENIKNETANKDVTSAKPKLENIIGEIQIKINNLIEAFTTETQAKMKHNVTKQVQTEEVSEGIKLQKYVVGNNYEEIYEEATHIRDLLVYQTITNTVMKPEKPKQETELTPVSKISILIPASERTTENNNYFAVTHTVTTPASKMNPDDDNNAKDEDQNSDAEMADSVETTFSFDGCVDVSSSDSLLNTKIVNLDHISKNSNDMSHVSFRDTDPFTSKTNKTVNRSILNELLNMDDKDFSEIEKNFLTNNHCKSIIISDNNNIGPANIDVTAMCVKVSLDNQANIIENDNKNIDNKQSSNENKILQVDNRDYEVIKNSNKNIDIKHSSSENEDVQSVDNRHCEIVISSDIMKCTDDIDTDKSSTEMITKFSKRNANRERSITPRLLALGNKVHFEPVSPPVSKRCSPSRYKTKFKSKIKNSIGTEASSKQFRSYVSQNNSADKLIKNVGLDTEEVKTLRFENQETSQDNTEKVLINPLKKNALESSNKDEKPEDKKCRVIPDYLKEVSDDIKKLMNDLMKPITDIKDFHKAEETELKKKNSICSTEIQANYFTSSQIDLEPVKSYVIIPRKRIENNANSCNDNKDLQLNTTFIVSDIKSCTPVKTSVCGTIPFDVLNPLNNISILSKSRNDYGVYNSKSDSITEAATISDSKIDLSNSPTYMTPDSLSMVTDSGPQNVNGTSENDYTSINTNHSSKEQFIEANSISEEIDNLMRPFDNSEEKTISFDLKDAMKKSYFIPVSHELSRAASPRRKNIQKKASQEEEHKRKDNRYMTKASKNSEPQADYQRSSPTMSFRLKNKHSLDAPRTYTRTVKSNSPTGEILKREVQRKRNKNKL